MLGFLKRVGAVGISLIALGLSLGFASPVFSVSVDDLKPEGYVVDQAKVLDADSLRDLTQQLTTIRNQRNAEGSVVLVNTTSGVDITDFATKLFRKFGIGEKEKNNGFLVLISVDDRKSRIEVGYGVEGVITDGLSGVILRNARTHFAARKYGEGLKQILTDIDGLLAKDPDTQQRLQKSANKNAFTWKDGVTLIVLFFSFGLPILAAMMARSKSWWAGGFVGAGVGTVLGTIFGWLWIGIGSIIGLGVLGLLFDYILSKNYKEQQEGGGFDWLNFPTDFGSSGGWGNGSSSSDSFGGFGGGSSGGGGASDSW